MKYFVVTGGSKGIGEFIIRNLFDFNHTVLCLSRTINEELVEEAKRLQVPTSFKSFDLSHVNEIADLVNNWKDTIDTENLEGIYLINNAGIIGPVNPFYECQADELIKNIQVNLLAPMILQSEFVKVCHDLVGRNSGDVELRILNISSGAASSAIPGWSAYCSSKAGVDMFTNCAVEDLQGIDSQIKVVALAPGIVDTDMQVEIRSSKESEFSLVNQFRGYQENGQLLKPEFVGEKIVEFIFSEGFGNESVTRINQI